MRRINTAHRAADLFGPGKDGFRNGDMGLGIMPTELNAEWFNMMQEEVAGVCEAAGLTLNPANSAQLLEAIKRMIDIQSGNYALDTGVANAYVIALDPAINAYTEGMTVRFRVVHGNTGASTLDAGAGPVALENDVAGALVNGDLPAGCMVSATYVAGNKFLINTLVTSQALSQAAADALYAKINSGKTVGEIFMHLGNAAPAGALIVPVAATSLSRAAYPALHTFCANLGYPWGAGDGATTFGMPYVAADEALVQANGNVRTTTVGQVIAHTHTGAVFITGSGTNSGSASPYINTQATGSTGGTKNLAAGTRVLLCVQYQ
jgi:hypothetical protein